MRVDWSKRADYVRARHAVEVEWANEAVNDGLALWLDPDPASRTGHSVRVIGYSGTAGVVLTVILVRPDTDPDDSPDGDWWGGNAWIASKRDQRTYGEADHGQD